MGGERKATEWQIRFEEQVVSTNDSASALEPWHCVRALRQSKGRGRHGREWVSGEGGLWFSAVLPTVGDSVRWKVLPLVAGLAVVSVLRRQGVTGVRMRWPNDVMIGERKVAGLLVDQFQPDRAVVGIGLNVFNLPGAEHPELKPIAIRLSEVMKECLEPDKWLRLILAELRDLHGRMEKGGFAMISESVNDLWEKSRRVRLEVDGGEEEGFFEGVDSDGNLILELEDGRIKHLSADKVWMLREI